jgi:hypothetical protein
MPRQRYPAWLPSSLHHLPVRRVNCQLGCPDAWQKRHGPTPSTPMGLSVRLSSLGLVGINKTAPAASPGGRSGRSVCSPARARACRRRDTATTKSTCSASFPATAASLAAKPAAQRGDALKLEHANLCIRPVAMRGGKPDTPRNSARTRRPAG